MSAIGHNASRRQRHPVLVVSAVLVLMAVIALVTGNTALAAPEAKGHIQQVTSTSAGSISVVFGAEGLPAGVTIDPATVKARIDGQEVPATAKTFGSSTTAPVRSALLTIDTSGSMNLNGGLDGAKKAAQSFLSTVPKDVLVGLVSFDDAARVVVPPTMDRARVRTAVAALRANGSTALYGAVVLSTATLGAQGIRSILLLSDGANSVEPPTFATAVADITKSRITLNAVSLGTDKKQVATLTALAKAGGGKVVASDQGDQLSAAFTAAAQAIATQVIVSVTVPPNVAGTSKPLTITATAGNQTIGDSIVALLPAAGTLPVDVNNDFGPQPVAVTQPGVTSSSWFLPVAIAAIGIALFILLAVAFVSVDSENAQAGRVRRRLTRYSLTSRSSESTVPTSGALGSSQVARSAVDLAGRVVQSRDLDTNLGTRLEAAGVPLRPAEWLLVHIGTAIGLSLILMLLFNFQLLPALIGLAIGVIVPYAYLTNKEARRKRAFAQQLPETLQLLSGSLSAGYSLAQATDVVVRESSPPMSVELSRSLVEARLGVPFEDALETTAKRMDSVDFSWVVMAIRIQREVGGNLAEVLTNVAATMRERERLRRQVDVLSAEGRLSAIVLGALPLMFIFYLILVRPEYISQLVTSPLGILMSVGAIVLMIGGFFWLRKVVKVEV